VRDVGSRPTQPRLLIVCEGKKTEPNYFLALGMAIPTAHGSVRVEGLGDHTLSLVERAVALRDTLLRSREVTETWVVFDRDSFEPAAFDNAIDKANKLGLECAWSNEAFELWFLLHFENRQSAMSRKEYSGRLRRHLKRPYRKNAEDMLELLTRLGSETKAIRWAEGLLDAHPLAAAPHDRNPCTTVHTLVRRLRTMIAGQGGE